MKFIEFVKDIFRGEWNLLHALLVAGALHFLACLPLLKLLDRAIGEAFSMSGFVVFYVSPALAAAITSLLAFLWFGFGGLKKTYKVLSILFGALFALLFTLSFFPQIYS